jgi:hypothetical protein
LRKAALTSVLNWHFMPAGAGATRAITITFNPPSQTAKAVPAKETRARQKKATRDSVELEVREAEERAASLRASGNPELAQTQAKLDQLREKRAIMESAGSVTAEFLFHDQPTMYRVQTGVPAYQPNAQNPPVISRIEAGGLSDEVTKELLARLPAHAGDLLTPDRLTAIRQAAQQFDEHFRVAVVPIPDLGDSVVAVRIDLESNR